MARTLTEGAELAVSLAGGDRRRIPGKDTLKKYDLSKERAKLALSQRYIRALYSGGTLCDEAMLLLSEQLGPIASNIPLRPGWALAAGETFRGHTALDLGSDEFTRGRPHPMIDARLRSDRILETGADATVAVLLLDIVLGYGSHPDPAGALVPAIVGARVLLNKYGRERWRSRSMISLRPLL